MTFETALPLFTTQAGSNPARPYRSQSFLHPFPLDFTSHSYYYITLFVSCFDITVGLGSLFQRIASIYDRFYLSSLYKLF